MANLLNITAKVLGIIGNKIDGDAVLLIDQHMTQALNTVCKFVAETKPVGHEKLLLQQTYGTLSLTAGQEYPEIDFSSTTYPFVYTGEFHAMRVRLQTDLLVLIGDKRAYPVHSMSALSLAVAHGVPYYFIEPDKIYLNVDVTDIEVNVVAMYATHYIYANITQFPDALEDLLVGELVRIIQNEIPKQMQEKNEV